MRRWILAGLAAVLLAGASARAEERKRSYGGGGADRLTRLIEYQDGLIAVGQTSSADGDLDIRTRSNQAGWMMRLNSAGTPLWQYCTAKDGRSEMSVPFAHENGQISAVLTGRGIDGLEWLTVSGQGRLTQRREAPAVEEVCAHGGVEMTGMPYDRDGAPHLALIVDHGDGTCCVADMDADGRLSRGAAFEKGAAVFAPCADGSGSLAAAYVENGEAGVLLIAPGADDTPTRTAISGDSAEEIAALLPLADGSTVISGRLPRAGQRAGRNAVLDDDGRAAGKSGRDGQRLCRPGGEPAGGFRRGRRTAGLPNGEL